MLHEFIAISREEIIRRCRGKVATRSVPPPTDAEIDHGVPVFLDQLADALRLGLTSSPEIGRTALQHGHDMLRQGFTVSQVVHDYGDVCQSITELAGEMNAPISMDDFRTLNRCLDEAIAGAVTEYGRVRNQSTLDGETARGSERLGFFAHELRNLLHTALMAFEVLKTGNVGVGGSTGTVLHRTLMASHSLVTRSLAEVRLTQGIQNREQLLVAGFIEEIASASTLDANARGVTLVVMPVNAVLAIAADRQVLAAVVGNLHAFKFTRPRTTVTLRVGASASACSLRSRTSAAVCPVGVSTSSFARSSSAAPIKAAWALVSPLADGALKPTMAGSMRATCLAGDACSPSTCRGCRFRPSPSFRLDAALSTSLARRARTPESMPRLGGTRWSMQYV
jgi:hypothetical protein